MIKLTKLKWLLVFFMCLFFSEIAVSDQENINSCLQKQLLISDDSVTVGELKALCEADTSEQLSVAELVPSEGSAITRRQKMEELGDKSLFSLIPHKPNYIIISNNLAAPNAQPYIDAFPNRQIHLQPWETKFQISLKMSLARGLFFGKGDLYAAYTGRSFWQQFNKAGSSPFRETNHEPEFWVSFSNDSEYLGFKNSVIRTGIVHQSNGQAGSLSRSWNRVYADFILEKGNWYFSLKPWWRIPEKDNEDDNPDIDDYMGNFEFGGLYKKGEHTFDFTMRDNLNFSNNHGALQLGWSFPISKKVKGYVQWFNGYGESLIDYNSYSNSIGIGIKLSDWL
jgi:phospholipase A1